MGQIENNICDAINILVDKAISNIKLDKTVLGTIEECIDEGSQKYRVKYQDSSFNAYSTGNQKYRKKSQVYVLIPANDNTQDRIILGSVDKLGDGYITAISAENKMTKVGCNIFNHNQVDSLCSYKTKDITYNNDNPFGINIDDLQLNYYQEQASYFMIAANFQTTMPEAQRYGQGDYGIIVTCTYYNENSKQKYNKEYILHVPNMTGQPYQFNTSTRQYGIFQLEDKLIEIPEIKLFVKDFPEQIITVVELPSTTEVLPNKCYHRVSDDTYWIYQQNKWNQTEEPSDDIFISDYEFYYLQALSDDEIAGAALKIETTKYGSVFKEDLPSLLLKARLKLSGSIVYDTSEVKYYWFVRDLTINSESKDYYYLGGEYWRCLNPKLNTSTTETETQTDNFAASKDEKTITLNDCPSSSLSFKCVAVVDNYILEDTIIIHNQIAEYQINLASKYGNSFPFDSYKSEITATVKDNTGKDISKNCQFVWGYETDEGGFYIIPNENKYILKHYPSGNHIKYIASVLKNNVNIGSAELLLTNQEQQQEFILNLINGNQVFKYSVEGTSPVNKGQNVQNQQIIKAIGFELYDRYGNIVGINYKEDGSIEDERLLPDPLDPGHHLLDCVWYFPAENTMLVSDRSDDVECVIYNGIKYYKYPIYNDNQLNFVFTISNKYNKNYINNDIILEVKYKNYTCTASTNFTITKEGELGTNGTKYMTRIVPNDSSIKQVFVHNNLIKCLKVDGTIQNYNGVFNIQVWDGGTNAVYNSNTAHWEVLPRHSSIYKDDTINVKYADYNIKLNNSTKGTIVSMNKNFAQNTTLQGWVTSSDLSRLPCNCYATYPIPVVYSTDDDICYIIEGGYNEVMYEEDGSRSNFNDMLPFKLKRVKISTQEITEISSANWYISWLNIIESGNNKKINPPSKLTGKVDNYIKVSYGNDYIIWSVHFYINRYSMPSFNEWDGTGIEIDQDRNTILAPQIAAGKKNNEDNTFTGVAIGTTFNKGNSNNKDIGLFGYYHNVRTIFLDAQTGEATFGVNAQGCGSLKITPGKFDIQPDGSIKPKNDDSIVLKSGNFKRAKYEGYGYDKKIKTPGQGVEINMSTNNAHIYFGNGNFELDEKGNIFLEGTIRASEGKIGGWLIDETKLKNSTMIIDAEKSIIKACESQIEEDIEILKEIIKQGAKFDTKTNKWNHVKEDLIKRKTNDPIKAPSVDLFLNSNFPTGSQAEVNLCNNWIKYLQTQDEAQTSWKIDGKNKLVQFGNSETDMGYLKFDAKKAEFKISGDLEGDNWNIDRNGSFKFGGKYSYDQPETDPSLSYIKFDPNYKIKVKNTLGEWENKKVGQVRISGNLTGNNWYINQDGNFRFGPLSSCIQKVDIKDKNGNITGSKVEVRADLGGATDNDWYIKRNGSAYLAKGNFQFDSTGNVKINANSGSMKLENVTLTYNKIPLQGETFPINCSSGFRLSNVSCVHYPGFAVFSFILTNYSGESQDNVTVTGFPKCNECCYFLGYDGNSKNILYTGDSRWKDNTSILIYRLTDDKIGKEAQIVFTGVYPVHES